MTGAVDSAQGIVGSWFWDAEDDQGTVADEFIDYGTMGVCGIHYPTPKGRDEDGEPGRIHPFCPCRDIPDVDEHDSRLLPPALAQGGVSIGADQGCDLTRQKTCKSGSLRRLADGAYEKASAPHHDARSRKTDKD